MNKINKGILVPALLIFLIVGGVLITVFGFGKSKVEITKITLDKSSVELTVGKSITLTATIEPGSANGNITWNSSNSSIAIVDQEGNVTGKSEGTATVTAKTINGLSANCKIIVKKDDATLVQVSSIVLNKDTANLEIGKSIKLEATITPGNATNQSITWKSSNTDVATVTQSGAVTGKSEGTAVITATSNNGKSATCTIKVTKASTEFVAVTKVTLSETNISIQKGSTYKLTVTISPSNATSKPITWKSSNESIATVDQNGNVIGKSEGKAVITVTTTNGNKTATCNVTVTKASSGTVEVKSIKLDKTSLNISVGKSTKLTATISPSNATNKTITWKSSNSTVATVDNNGNVKGNGEGTATIKATSSNGKTAEAKVTVKKTTSSSPTKNKRALFVGDSITYGKDGHYSWADYIGEKYDLKKTVNAGLSGGVLSTFRGEKWLVDVLKQHKDEKYDYVILHGGINDISLTASRGEPKGSYKENDFSGKYDTGTFIGGLETYIYTAKKLWPNAKIGFIINYRTPTVTKIDSISTEYYKLIMKVCKKWGVKYINLYSGKASNGKKYSDILKVTTNTYLSDGVHLNKQGYKTISPYIYKWMKTL